MSLAAKLKSLRVGKGESLQQVADAIGASKPHVWELESGRSTNPSLDLLKRIAEHFGTTVAYLIGEKPGESMVFGREFKNVTEEEKKLIMQMVEKLAGTPKRGR